MLIQGKEDHSLSQEIIVVMALDKKVLKKLCELFHVELLKKRLNH